VNDSARNPQSSIGPWLVAVLAVAASAGWLAWQWQRRTPDLATARVYVDGKAWEKAAPMLERIRAADPSNAEAARLLSFCYRHLQRFQDAASVLESIEGDDEETAAAVFFAGQALLEGERRREAERRWKSVLERESTPGVEEWKQECRRELCNLYAVERRRRDFLAASEEMFDFALPRDRHTPLQYRLRSLVNIVEPNAAIKKLEPAVAADPNDLFSKAAIALYLADLDKFDDAIARVQECRTKAPDELFFWEAYCLVLDRRGDVPGIAAAVGRTPAGAEQSAVAARMQSIAAEHRGDLDAAAAFLRKALALDPEPGHRQRLGNVLMRQRQPDAAKRELEIAKAQQPVLGEVKEFMQRYQAEAPEDLRRFADWASEAASLVDKLERPDEARRWRIAALAADPNHRPSLAALERDAARRFGRE
jgi:tetratricopeptide (TPR) repeat protein